MLLGDGKGVEVSLPEEQIQLRGHDDHDDEEHDDAVIHGEDVVLVVLSFDDAGLATRGGR